MNLPFVIPFDSLADIYKAIAAVPVIFMMCVSMAHLISALGISGLIICALFLPVAALLIDILSTL